MTTRAGAANQALRAKETIVRLLHGFQHHHSTFSFEELRRAFLKRAQEIHPDKAKFKKDYQPYEFIQLKEAWEQYEKTSKIPTGIRSPEGTAGTFTMFGVGCSFSDSESERLERSKIMDEASRGWFSAGEIAADSLNTRNEGQRPFKVHVKLASDDLFKTASDDTLNDRLSEKKPSLVSHLVPKHKR